MLRVAFLRQHSSSGVLARVVAAAKLAPFPGFVEPCLASLREKLLSRTGGHRGELAAGVKLLRALRVAIARIRRRWVDPASLAAAALERAFPHIVELSLPPDGLGTTFHQMLGFHRDRSIPHRRSEDLEQHRVRYQFADPADAEAFRDQFGGES